MSLDANSLDEGLALALLGRAVHAAGTRALDGMAELTFYDTLVAVAAAEGARRRKAWIIERELKPTEWNGDERVDLVILREVGGTPNWVSAAELKWWRASDGSNASNRRRDLVVDFLRAASVHGFVGVEERALVVLVTTGAAWNSTTQTSGRDAGVCVRLNAAGPQSWSLRALKQAPAVKNAVGQVRRSLQLPSTFQSTLVRHVTAPAGGGNSIEVRIWSLRKPQRSLEMTEASLSALFGAAAPGRASRSSGASVPQQGPPAVIPTATDPVPAA